VHVDFVFEWQGMREKIAVEKNGGGNCERIVKGNRRSTICAMQIAWSMVSARSASRAAQTPLLAPDDAPSSLLMVEGGSERARGDTR
jgi:hypothetical protein